MRNYSITKNLLKQVKVIVSILFFICSSSSLYSATITSNQTGNWSSTSTWQGGVVPVSGDAVVITNSHTITLDASSLSCASIQVTGTLNFNSNDFTVTGNVTYSNGGTIAVGASNFTIGGNVTFGENAQYINFTTGTITVSGNITYGGNSSATSGFICSGTGWLVMNGISKIFTLRDGNNITIPRFRLGSSSISVNTQNNSTSFIVSSSFDMNNQTAFTHTCSNGSIINVTGTIANASNMNLTTSSNGEFKYSGGGEIAAGTYYKLTTSTNAITIPCGRTVTVSNTFTNSTTLTGSVSPAWAKVVNATAVSNSGTIGSASTNIAFSGSISGGSTLGTLGTNTRTSATTPTGASTTAVCIIPTITVSSTSLSSLSYCDGLGPSTSQSYTVSGINLTDNIVLTASINYEISSGSGYTNTLTLTQSGGNVSTTTIYVRLKSGLSVASYNSEIISHTSTGATTKNVTCSGSVNARPTTAVLAGTATICNATATNLTVTIAGGVSPFTVVHSGGTVNSYTSASNISVSPSSNTTYTLTSVTDANSCTATTPSGSANITVLSIPTTPGSITSNSPQCVGTAITFTKGSCAGGSTCYWVSSATGTETSNSSASYTTATTVGTYNLWVRAYNGTCWSVATTASGTINASPAITVQPSSTTQSLCQNVVASALSITATGGGLSYQWYKNASSSNSGGSAVSGANLATYTPSTTASGTAYYYCIASGTCSPSVSSSVSGLITTKASPSVSITTNSPLTTSGVISLTGSPSGFASYLWSGPNSFTSAIQNPTIVYPTTAASGTYSLTATSTNGCSNTASASVTVTSATVFTYSGTDGNFNTYSNWTPNPTNFSADGQTFIINKDDTLVSNWTVSGAGSKIIVGDGSTTLNFTIASGVTLTTTSPVSVDVKNNATLTLSNDICPTLGYLSSGSTVVYNSTGAQTIQANNYSKLTISGSRTGTPIITLASGIISVSSIFTPSATGCTWSTTGNTFIFDGIGSQDIPSFTYNNIQTQLGGTKTLIGNISILGVLTVGNITTFNASSNIITFAGTGGKKRILATGTFLPGTSKVNYTVANDTVSAVNYYDLDLTGGSGKFETSDMVGIQRNFIPGTVGAWTSSGSEVICNGTLAQTIPAFPFGSLMISNPAGVTLTGNISISGILTFKSGILATSSYSLSVTNTAANAVSTGSTTSFLNGSIIRYFPSAVSSSSIYNFPVGSGSTYLPLSMTKVETGVATIVTVQAIVSNPNGLLGTNVSAVSTSEYWSVVHNNPLKASVSLTRQSAISSISVIAHSSEGVAGHYNSVGGTSNTSTNTIVGSDLTTFSELVIATSSIAATIYNYDGSGDITSTSNWVLSTDGTTHPASFDVDNITFVVKNSAAVTVSSNWSITGANTTLQIGDGTNPTALTIASGISVTTSGNVLLQCNSTLNLSATSIFTIAGNVTTSACGSAITVSNLGTINVSGTLTQPAGSNSTITNGITGIINVNSDYTKGQNTSFVNYGHFNITNGNFYSDNNSANTFNNKNGGIVLIDNTLAPNKIETLANINFSNGLVLESGSRFSLINTNLTATGSGNWDIAGILSIQDGDMTYSAGGSDITIALTGAIYLYDTDNTGDGVLKMNWGGQALTVNGVFFAEGLQIPTGGGTAVTVASGANMFIGNIGLYTGSNSNDLVVQNGGVLNFCGNKSAGADNVGTVNPGGTLNYALGYYTTQTPGSTTTGGQGDFAGTGSMVAAYADASSCLAAFDNTVSNVLPISLEYFDVKLNGEIVALEWKTATETNNDFFTIMKSYDASTFEILGRVNGAGTSSIEHYYMINDVEPQNGVNYYKIKQTDFDGASTFSPIRSIKYKKKNVFLQVYPIPGKSEDITLKLWSEKSETVTLIISDLMGRVYSSGQIEVSNDRMEIPLSNFAKFVPGKYIVTVFSKLFVDNVDIIVE